MTTWLGVWTRAVVGPAVRRAAAVWAGCGILAAVVFGPTGMHPRDLTQLMLGGVATASVVGGTWLLLFTPVARGLVHADEARYLRSLPGPRGMMQLVRVGALVALQLPWLVLWIWGEGAFGLAPIAGTTLLAVAIGAWQPRTRTHGAPRWRSALRAFIAIYLAALRRRAGDALVRGAGLAIFAGLAGGLFVRNNQLVGAEAAKLATIVVVLVSVPAQAGVLGTLLAAHRSAAWLAQSLGVTPTTRTLALALALVTVHVVGALLAIVGVALVDAPDAATLALLAGTTLVCALASAVGMAAVILRANHAALATGAFSVGAAIAVLLTLLETPAGPLAALTAAGLLLARAKAD